MRVFVYNVFMRPNVSVDKDLERHLRIMRNELIWTLSYREYTDAQIGRVFNINRSTVKRVVAKKPKDWKSEWKKVQE